MVCIMNELEIMIITEMLVSSGPWGGRPGIRVAVECAALGNDIRTWLVLLVLETTEGGSMRVWMRGRGMIVVEVGAVWSDLR